MKYTKTTQRNKNLKQYNKTVDILQVFLSKQKSVNHIYSLLPLQFRHQAFS